MPDEVTVLHQQYEEFAPDWKRCRDAFGGRRLVKRATTEYLKKLEAEKTDEYAERLNGAQWFDATERTTRGMTGAILRNDTRIEVPPVVEPDLEDVTLTGQDVHAFSQRILIDQILMGRVGVEVAMPREESPDQRPYWNLWAAESITNWAAVRIFGRLEPIQIVLKEPVMKRTGQFGWSDKEDFQYRVLRLVSPTPGSLVYIQEIWIKNPQTTTDSQQQWILDDTIIPSRRGVLLDEIPFTLFGVTSIELKVEKPPMMGVCDLNLGWYVNSADYETALAAIKPLYVFSGLEQGTEIVLGSRRAVILDESDGRGDILQGADPEGLRKAMVEKEKAMSVVGGQILDSEAGPAETATAHRIRAGGKQANLRTIATTFGVGLERVLGHHATWVGADPGDVTVTPNMDFIDATLTPDQLRAYLETLQQGKIAYETFYNLLRGGELTRPGVDAEAELEEIEADEEGALNKANEEIVRLEAERQLSLVPDGDEE